MPINPNESPQEECEPGVPSYQGEGTDWLALVGLFVGALVASYAGGVMADERITNSLKLPIIFGIICLATFAGWLAGGLAGRRALVALPTNPYQPPEEQR